MNCTTERPGTEVFVQKMCKVSWQSCVHVLLTFCAQSGVHQLCPLISILLAPIHLLSTFLADPFVCKWASGQVGKWASGLYTDPTILRRVSLQSCLHVLLTPHAPVLSPCLPLYPIPLSQPFQPATADSAAQSADIHGW